MKNEEQHNLSKSVTIEEIPLACSDELAAVELFKHTDVIAICVLITSPARMNISMVYAIMHGGFGFTLRAWNTNVSGALQS